LNYYDEQSHDSDMYARLKGCVQSFHFDFGHYFSGAIIFQQLHVTQESSRLSKTRYLKRNM